MNMRMQIRWQKFCKSGKKNLAFIPFMFTFANACLGLLAVLSACEDNYVTAAICIILAAFFDTCDGRLARAFGSCSSLGMELDSLCDATSFCFAPVIVLYGAYLSTLGIIGILTAGVYLCAGLFRLAKFNNTSSSQRLFFIGMPTPVPALFFSLLVVHSSPSSWQIIDTTLWPWLVALLVILFSYLMDSVIRFPTFKSGIFNSRFSMIVIFGMLLSAILGLLFHVPVLLCILAGYIIFSIVANLIISLV